MTKIVDNRGIMVAQLVLFDGFGKIKHSRCHFKTPTYRKFYSVKRYNRDKFRRYLNYQLKEYKCVKYMTQEEILKLCYLKDAHGIIYDSDEKSIFRIRNLHNLHTILFEKINKSIWNDKGTIDRDGLVSYLEERQTEIKGTWQLPVKKRVRLHIRLLWLLKDYNISESMDWLNEVDVSNL